MSRAYLEGDSGKAAAQIGWLDRGSIDGIICLSGGPEGAIDPYFANGHGRAWPSSGSTRCASCSATASMSNCSATAGRRRPPNEAAADRLRLPAAACRWSRPTSRSSRRRGDYEAHDALLAIAARHGAGADRAAQAHRRALFQVARRDAGAVRGSARGARQHRRDRPPRQLPAADARPHPAALRRRARTRPRKRAWPPRPRRCASRRARA